jgi:NADPH-dependent 2,4-dienoyl-CoA reductase/sulfur reductase-like enzyme
VSSVEFAIVGAGPAGMAAATLAAELGLDTMLIDEQAAPGGQIYRGVETAGGDSALGADYLAGKRLVEAVRAARLDYRPKTTLWHLDPDGALYLATEGGAATVSARRILLATGAIERPAPIPGWTLPGVMTAGAAQILLKTSGLTPQGRTVLAGQGPLLFLVGAQLARAGAPPEAILETTPLDNYLAAARRRWPGSRTLVRVLGWMLTLKRAGVPVRRGVRGLRAFGHHGIERVAWNGGEIAADYLFLHEGVIPEMQVAQGVQLRCEWSEDQLAWRPALDQWGQTSLPCVAVAGDAGGILGAEAAALTGRLAALDAASLLGHIAIEERDRRAQSILDAVDRERAARPFLDRLYRPTPSVLVPPDDETVVCRCEAVTAGDIRSAVQLGAPGPNQVKAFTRCGMGPCQGRLCGPVAAAIIANMQARPIAEIGTFRPRAPYKPLTVGALADLGPGDTDVET